jgi:hypothetical protein
MGLLQVTHSQEGIVNLTFENLWSGRDSKESACLFIYGALRRPHFVLTELLTFKKKITALFLFDYYWL